jgi:hypothetical protein
MNDTKMYAFLTNGRGDKVEKNKMGGACSTFRGRGEVYIGFRCGNLRERDHLEDPSTEGKIILRWIFRKWDVESWIELAQDTDRWRALVNAVMYLRVQ